MKRADETKVRKPRPDLYVANWFDSEGKIFRIAGIYDRESSAWRRVRALGSGTVQHLKLGKPVRFVHDGGGRNDR